ncbi:hypothetical protein [Spirosoma flavum]|uniref:DUF4254 domain-containing protein n=1 Tax=Spirosoma flavum TaxID=2048557 RepID=A0ABW6AU73_9BACT
MSSTDELDSVRRIVLAIKTYRHQTSDYQPPLGNELLRAYLQHYLSAQDWQLWQDLHLESNSSPDFPSDDKEAPRKEFEKLLSQYRRAGYELIQSWQQENSKLVIDCHIPVIRADMAYNREVFNQFKEDCLLITDRIQRLRARNEQIIEKLSQSISRRETLVARYRMLYRALLER